MSSSHRPIPSPHALSLLDWGKALAAQLIVWHHLAIYGPMRHAVEPLVPQLWAWLADPARWVVQVFLVIAGYLAARGLMPQPNRVRAHGLLDTLGLIVRRYGRLMRPLAVALLAALLAAALARMLIDDPDTPAAPGPAQLIAHLLLLQDVLGLPALSTGVWYVAIDLQLYALLAGLAWLLRARGQGAGALGGWPIALGLVALVAASLWSFNRDSRLEVWAPYFVGAYGLGVLAHWTGVARRPLARAAGLLLMLALIGVALWIEWRERIALAGAVALLLALDLPAAARLARSRLQPAVAALARSSYAVFLLHYPIGLAIGALVASWAADRVALNALGLLATWGLSLAAGHALTLWLEGPTPARRRLPAAADPLGRGTACG